MSVTILTIVVFPIPIFLNYNTIHSTNNKLANNKIENCTLLSEFKTNFIIIHLV